MPSNSILKFPLKSVFFLFVFSVISLSAKESNPGQLKYVKNNGQWHENVLFKAEFNRGAIFLEDQGFTFLINHKDDLKKRHAFLHAKEIEPAQKNIRAHAYKVDFIGANSLATLQGENKYSFYQNYFIGNDQSKWASNVPVFEKVSYLQLYNGIDLKVHSSEDKFKYDFIVNPGADPSLIVQQYKGLKDIFIDNGHLVMETSVGQLRELAPYCYQKIGNKTIEVACNFLLNNNKVSFYFPEGWNENHELVIDPVLVAATLSGTAGTENYGHSATYDGAGNMYTGAICFGTGYPTSVGSVQQNYGGGWNDITISKLSPDGITLLYSTYLGGGGDDYPHSLVVTDNDELFVLGSSSSTNFPTSLNAYSSSLNGSIDIVISKLNVSGNNLLGSTYIGGSADDGQNNFSFNYGDTYRGEIIVDAAGNPYVASVTSSNNFPMVGTPYQATAGGLQDGVVFKMNTDLSGLSWSTYLGGFNNNCCYGIRLDAAGDAYVCGSTEDPFLPNQGFMSTYQGGNLDGYVVKLSGGSSTLSASTYWGTTSEDQAFFLDLDLDGDVYIYGQSQAGTSPVTPGVYFNASAPQFIAKLDPTLTNNIYATILGNASSGFGYDFVPIAFMVDKCEYVYWSGHSTFNQLPVSANPLQTSGGFYLGVLQPGALGLEYATHYGGQGDHVDGGTSRFDPQGIVYQAVCTSTGFSTTPGAWSSTYPTSSWGGTGYDIGVFKIDFQVFPIDADASVQPSSAGCAPFTVGFVNSSQGVDYLWDFNDGTPIDTAFQPTHTFNNPGVYNVQLIAIDSSACVTTDTTYLTITVGSGNPVTADFNHSIDCANMSISAQNTGTSGMVYQWDMGDQTTYGDSTVLHSYSSAGQYDVQLVVLDTICGTTDTLLTTINILPNVVADISALPDSIGCIPLEITFANNSNGVDYLWDFGDGSPLNNSASPTHVYNTLGSFQVSLIASDSINSCNFHDTAYVTIVAGSGNPVIADFSYLQNSDCDLFEVQTTNLSSGDNLTFEWDMGDASLYTDSNVVHQYSGLGTYVVTLVAYDSVCNNSDTAVKVISLQASLVVDIGADQLICPYEQAVFDASVSGATYLWNTGDTTATIYPQNAGMYSVIIFDGVCEATDSAFLSFSPYNSRSYVTEICLGEGVILDAGPAQSYLWSTSETSRQISVDQGAQYWFQYTDDYGCTYEDTVEVVQREISRTVFAPNAFSPDADGHNDNWQVVGQGIEEYKIYVFNRWGEMIWISKNIDDVWDGTFKGKQLPIDAYVYKLSYSSPCAGNELIEKTGHILIIR